MILVRLLLTVFVSIEKIYQTPETIQTPQISSSQLFGETYETLSLVFDILLESDKYIEILFQSYVFF